MERIQGGNSAPSEALPGKETDLDFGLVQPASVRGSVVNCQAAPEIAAVLLAEASARSMSDAVSASFRKP